jgi:hypothetical protein
VKKISLAKAFEFLKLCPAILVGEEVALNFHLKDLNGNPRNLFLHFYDDEIGGASFVEENNQEVMIDNALMILQDNEGDEIKITLLGERNVEKELFFLDEFIDNVE